MYSLNDRESKVRMTGQKKAAVSSRILTKGAHYKNILNPVKRNGGYWFVQEMLLHASLT